MSLSRTAYSSGGIHIFFHTQKIWLFVWDYERSGSNRQKKEILVIELWSSIKRHPTGFLVDDAINDENSVITLNPATMEQLDILGGDILLVKGKKRKDTVCMDLADDRCDKPKILINKFVRSRRWLSCH
ncbi:hypothetical protein OIU76_021918 [Salix suchowensis]|uniref:CDC48 N-terminal subdomain domain-containing protein n=1 Tax=Salix suchowensis TaxID=1278906 RepID=A0ABQ9AIR3_9ROSI|nr:hypothetical protein OIU76_021918 [Salix suchowensis]KAJ6340101.1 hypothetical protein OIU77_007949 [Salix suchowensis]